MREPEAHYNEIDDYIAEMTEAEREELVKAEAAIDLAFLFHRARETRGLTQAEAAKRTGLHQQSVSRLEQPDMKMVNTKIDTLRRYLTALNYVVQVAIKDAHSGSLVKQISFGLRHDVDIVAAQAAPQPLDAQALFRAFTVQQGDTSTAEGDASGVVSGNEDLANIRQFAVA